MRRRVLLAVTLVLPRLWRMLAAPAQFTDSTYMDGFVRVAHGQRPYRDFVHPQTPLPEYVIGGLERIFGTSHRVSEIVTALVALLASYLVYRLARRRLGEPVAWLAAILFAWHPTLILSDVFSREVMVAAAALGCALAASLPGVGVAAAIGFACKPTFALVVPALLGARPRAGIVAGAACAAVFGLCLWAYGRPFWMQVVVFHSLKGRVWSVWEYAQALWEVLPLLLPWALCGAGAARAERIIPVWLGLGVAFFVFASPTIWEHNTIEILPALAISAAAGAVWLWRRSGWLSLSAVAASGVLAVILSSRQSPRYWIGLDGTPRRELAALAARLRDVTPQDGLVLAPAEISAEANCMTLVHNPEIEGLVLAATRAQAEGWLDELRSKTRKLPFRQLHERSRMEWRPLVEQALERQRLAAVVIDERAWMSTGASLQSVRVSEKALRRRGFRPALYQGYYTLFISCARPSPACESLRAR